MKKYRKKPVVIEAVQLRRDNWKEVSKFIPDDVFQSLVILDKEGVQVKSTNLDNAETFGMYINTLEGQVLASENDYIIRGVDGEFYPCKPHIFLKTYEPAEDDEQLPDAYQ